MRTVIPSRPSLPAPSRRAKLLPLVLGLSMAMAACGGGSSSSTFQVPLTVSGNWQFTMSQQLDSDPTKPSFSGGLQGGFLIQSGNSASGQVNFQTMTQPPFGSGGTPTPCNNGIAQVSGTVSVQTVTLTAKSVGAQTYSLTGTLSYDGATITGSYTSTDGAGCGIAATGTWSASLIPALTSSSIQGTFHSTGGTAGLTEQMFLVSGQLFQGQNNGGSTAALTGNLNFGSAGYPCFSGVTVAGQISGNTVSLQILGPNNTTVGQVGPLTLISTGSGPVLQSLTGIGYAVFAPGCGGGTLQAPADSGSVCLAVASTNACQLPLSINPAALGFPPAAVGSSKTSLSVTLLNPSSSAVISGLTITLTNNSDQTNFTESDNCGTGGTPTKGQMFTLQPSQICSISVGYSPQQVCPSGGSGVQCLGATLSIASSGLQTVFAVPITGGVSGVSATDSDPGLLPNSREFEKHAQ